MTSAELFMSEALKEAQIAYDKGEVPIGAVVVFNGEIIGRGHNERETLKDPTRHAEISALQAAAKTYGDWRLTGADLYVTIEPCVMCTGAAQQSRIKRIVFGSRDPKGGAAKSLYEIPSDQRFNHVMEVVEGVMEDECRNIMRDFFSRLRK
jgi:tRNA(adenine34) deaminase